MTITTEVDDFLAGGGASAPSLKFETKGDTYEGQVVASEVRDVTDFATGDVQTYPDGKPKKQLHVTLDVAGEERSLWAKGQMLNALREALAGQKLEIGGTLKVKWVDEKKNDNPRLNAQKIYLVKWTPPATTTEVAQADDPAFGDTPF